MAEELQEKLLTGLGNDKAPDGGFTHTVLSLSEVQTVENSAAPILVVIQNQFYEKGYSFVSCCMQKEVEDQFNKLELLELMNITPTESEAWDILQMEEIERELLNDSES
jgi:anti-anti-sigma regulatory factor